MAINTRFSYIKNPEFTAFISNLLAISRFKGSLHICYYFEKKLTHILLYLLLRENRNVIFRLCVQLLYFTHHEVPVGLRSA